MPAAHTSRHKPLRSGLRAGVVTTLVCLAGCQTRPSGELIFIDGRAVEAVGDSLLGYTVEGEPALQILDIGSGHSTAIGRQELHGPVHVQHTDGRWYVSDVMDGRPSIAVFDNSGSLEHRIDLDGITPIHHQFAALPDGRVVVQSTEESLIVIEGDSSSTFALTDVAQRTALMLGVSGGVLHAVPGHHITLYNAFGNIRWRVEWQWRDDTFVTDLARDRVGRIQVLVGVPETDEGRFRIYTMLSETGEVNRWSGLSERATFVVDRLGEVQPDSAARWRGSLTPGG